MSRLVDAGNGPPCPENPEHGHLMVLGSSGRGYCPHSGHREETAPMFEQVEGGTWQRWSPARTGQSTSKRGKGSA